MHVKLEIDYAKANGSEGRSRQFHLNAVAALIRDAADRVQTSGAGAVFDRGDGLKAKLTIEEGERA